MQRVLDHIARIDRAAHPHRQAAPRPAPQPGPVPLEQRIDRGATPRSELEPRSSLSPTVSFGSTRTGSGTKTVPPIMLRPEGTGKDCPTDGRGCPVQLGPLDGLCAALDAASERRPPRSRVVFGIGASLAATGQRRVRSPRGSSRRSRHQGCRPVGRRSGANRPAVQLFCSVSVFRRLYRRAKGGGAGCRGYELLADLDFDTNGRGGLDAGDAYWNDGSGRLPVGTAAEPFGARFEGNGRVVRHLFIAGAAGAGLFGATGPSSIVARVGARCGGGDQHGRGRRSGGRNGRRVTGCWATGRVSGSEAVGGLVGSNAGVGGGSYATAQVSGERQAGGLVGHHRGALAAGYATGRVRGEDEAGGLVGAAEPPGTVTAGYWDTGHVGPANRRGGPGAGDRGAAGRDDGLRRPVCGVERRR